MMQYRCYFFGANGQLLGAETVSQENDFEARATARRLFTQRAHAVGYELRQGRRSIEAYDEARTSQPPRAA